MADVKHITMTCPVAKCDHQAFVQVVKFKDKEIQQKVDRKARAKIKKQLNQWHKEGRHD